MGGLPGASLCLHSSSYPSPPFLQAPSPHLHSADHTLACQPQASLVTFLSPCLGHLES